MTRALMSADDDCVGGCCFQFHRVPDLCRVPAFA